MTRLFFQKHVPGDPVLAPLFANAPSGLPEQMAAWLGEVFRGPPSPGRAHGRAPRILPPHLAERPYSAPRGRPVSPLPQPPPRARPPPPPPVPPPAPPLPP